MRSSAVSASIFSFLLIPFSGRRNMVVEGEATKLPAHRVPPKLEDGQMRSFLAEKWVELLALLVIGFGWLLSAL